LSFDFTKNDGGHIEMTGAGREDLQVEIQNQRKGKQATGTDLL
jgi:hypothetical protein